MGSALTHAPSRTLRIEVTLRGTALILITMPMCEEFWAKYGMKIAYVCILAIMVCGILAGCGVFNGTYRATPVPSYGSWRRLVAYEEPLRGPAALFIIAGALSILGGRIFLRYLQFKRQSNFPRD